MNTKKFQITIIIVLVLLIGFLYFNNRETQNKVKIIETPKPIVSDLNVPDSWEDTSDNIEDYYFNLFSYADITIHQSSSNGVIIDPDLDTNKHIIYSKPKPDYTKKEPSFFVITLKDEMSGHYDFGYLNVTVYS